jgi:hypothetical protein
MPTPRELLALPKRVRSVGGAKRKAQALHVERDIELEAECEGKLVVFVRASRAVPENFSVGIRYEAAGVRPIPFIRVNGDHGPHTNEDGTTIPGGPHLHLTRDRYMDVEFSDRAIAKQGAPLPDMRLTLPAAWAELCMRANIERSEEVEQELLALHATLGQLMLGLDDD